MDQETVTYRQHLTNQWRISRRTLLGVIIMTVLNIVFLLMESGTYLLFSASVPYYLTWFGKGMDNDFGMNWDVNGSYTLIGFSLATAILLVYLAFWLLSAKHHGWLASAVVFLCIDLLALIGLSVWLLSDPMNNLVDIVFHLVAIWQIGKGVSADRKRRTLPPEQTFTVAEGHL